LWSRHNGIPRDLHASYLTAAVTGVGGASHLGVVTSDVVPDRIQRPIFITTGTNDPQRRSDFTVGASPALGKDAVH
jgi:hypothetical protein